jgi:hypothetical protein
MLHQWLSTAVLYFWWWIQQVLETCRELVIKPRHFRCILLDIRIHISYVLETYNTLTVAVTRKVLVVSTPRPACAVLSSSAWRIPHINMWFPWLDLFISGHPIIIPVGLLCKSKYGLGSACPLLDEVGLRSLCDLVGWMYVSDKSCVTSEETGGYGDVIM